MRNISKLINNNYIITFFIKRKKAKRIFSSKVLEIIKEDQNFKIMREKDKSPTELLIEEIYKERREVIKKERQIRRFTLGDTNDENKKDVDVSIT